MCLTEEERARPPLAWYEGAAGEVLKWVMIATLIYVVARWFV